MLLQGTSLLRRVVERARGNIMTIAFGEPAFAITLLSTIVDKGLLQVLLLGLQMLVPSFTVQVVPHHLLERMVRPRLTTKNVVSLHLVVKKLKLLGLLYLIAIEVLKILFVCW